MVIQRPEMIYINTSGPLHPTQEGLHTMKLPNRHAHKDGPAPDKKT